MFITKPIEKFEYKDNVLVVNETSFMFKGEEQDVELVESLISKGAYASALLYLNKNHLLETVNGKAITRKDYRDYLQECKDLMKENVYELKASNLKPLCSINGLELLENDSHIFRGKSKLMVEDFREKYFPDKVESVISSLKLDCTKENYMKALDKVSSFEYENVISKDEYDRAVKKINDIYREFKNKVPVTEEAEGTQASDIAPKIDQDMNGNLVEPPKVSSVIEESYDFKVGFNHKFKGFIMNEQGRYERGNFVLINEGGNVKAIHKSKLNGASSDEYGNLILSVKEAETKMNKLCDKLNKLYVDYGYDFNFRIEDEQIKLYDANESFYYEDENFDKVEEAVKKAFNSGVYLEPENSVIMAIAGCYIHN